ncbi:MAG: type II secretion system F family protein [Candidatus Doudnabacteria bacterium]
MEFKYVGVNKAGLTEKDVIEAGSYHEAVATLHQKGVIPTEINETKPSLINNVLVRFSKVSLQDKILFVQNLSIMMKAGIPLTRALKILSNQTKNPKMKEILTEIYNDVQAGKTIGESLTKYPRVFQNIFVSMFKVGELTGSLDKSLEQLAIQLQREHELTSKTKGAMIYPAVVVFAITLVGILMSIFVLPSLVGIFKDSQIPLPVMTRIVIAFTDFMSGHTFLALGIIFTVVGGMIAIMRTEIGQRTFDKALLYTPIFGEISKKINMARFSRTMSSMLKSGTPILDSLSIAADSMGNTQYKDAIKVVASDVRVGKSITASLLKYPHLFDYLVTQMIGVGEESGNVETILGEMAEHYEAEVDDTMKNMSSIIEPVMILVIGGVVGVLAMALISPIYSLTSAGGN